ncbi:MAG: pyridoxal phosphate-dependent aminotransferase [Eubacteriales bacterium]|nr:pyridoxal phosphate-dependent aminotransferase [Eubacteriales bacterium]
MPLGISEKAKNITPSATFAMDAKAKAMQAAGESVIGFAAGEPDFDTPVTIRDAMKDALDRGMTRYSAVAGTLELRGAIVEKLKRDNGLTYDVSQIIVSNGAKHSLYNTFFTLLDDGDEVIIPTPCWVSYPEMVKMTGGVPVFVPACEKDNFIPAPTAIAAAITPKTKAFVLTSPNNPNGCIWPESTLKAIAELAVKHGFYVISDEIYESLINSAHKHVSIASLGDEIKARTIVINGVSKTYAMTGFRIGYAAGPKDVIQAMIDAQSQATSAPNTPAQHAAAVALSMPQDCVESMRLEFEKRRDVIVKGINAIAGLSCRKPEGAFYVMMNVSALMGKRCAGVPLDDCAAFADALLTQGKVATVPGNAFMAEGFCRLSYATSMENILEGLRRIEAFVKALA